MEDEGAVAAPPTRARHIKKRALKNKALSLSFDEKDLRDFVTGFHKRKKKRRKEAQQQLQEAERRKRIEARKKRKLERELVYGGAPADTNAGIDEEGDDFEKDEETMLVPSTSGTTTYDSGNVKVTVTTSEISREEERPSERPQADTPIIIGGEVKKRQNVPLKKKQPFKRVAKNNSRRNQPNKRDKNKGKKKK